LGPPNTRVQRTRPYASLRGSPLTRHPLGGPLIIMALTLTSLTSFKAKPEEPIVEATSLSHVCSIQVAIYSSGVARQSWGALCQGGEETRRLRLTKKQLNSIKSTIADTRFCELPTRVTGPSGTIAIVGASTSSFFVTVRQPASRCTVESLVSGATDPGDDTPAARFGKVWSAITVAVGKWGLR